MFRPAMRNGTGSGSHKMEPDSVPGSDKEYGNDAKE